LPHEERRGTTPGEEVAVYKDSKTIRREHAEYMRVREREAATISMRGKVDRLKTADARTRFRNEEAEATDEDMRAYYRRTVPSARRPR
jgi:hypothetical protein